MAIDSFAPEFFDQRASPLELHDHPWVAASGVRSIGAGDGLSWYDLEGSVSSGSYTDGDDITYSAMTDKVYMISVSDKRYTGWHVTDLERAERIPGAAAEAMVQSNREQLVNLTSVIRTAYQSSARLGTGLTEPIRGNATGLTTNKKTITNSLATNVWDSAGMRALIVDAVLDARDFGRRHGWPSRFMCITPLEITSAIRRYLTVDKPNLGAGEMVDSVFTTAQVPMLYGAEFHEDTLVDAIDTSAALAAGNGLVMDFLIPGLSVQHISEAITVETLRDNDKPQTNGRTLWRNGAGPDAARHMYEVEIVLTA